MNTILQGSQLIVERNKKKVLEVDQVLIEKGELLSVIGPNGAGKSTLLMALSTLLPVSKGEIYFENTKIDDRNKLAFRRQIGMVLQDPLLLDTSVSENIGTGMRFRGIKESTIKKSVAHWAEQLNISHLLKRKSRQLSGGEAQRVKLARELSRRATGKTIYILDEPSVGLHAADVHKLVEVLQRLVDAGNSVVIIEHNLDIIKIADYIIDLGPEGGSRGGQLIAQGTPEEICQVPESYTGQYLKMYLEQNH